MLRVDLKYVKTDDVIPLMPPDLVGFNPQALPSKTSLIVNLPESKKQDFLDFIRLVDQPVPETPIHLRFMKADDLLAKLPPSVTEANVVKTNDPTLVFFKGSTELLRQFRKDLEQLDIPKPLLRYEILVLQFEKDKILTYTPSMTIQSSNTGNSFTGALGQLMNFNFDVVGSFGVGFGMSLNAAITDSDVNVVADTTLNGISGEKISFQNTTSTYYAANEISTTGTATVVGSVNQLSSGLILNLQGWISSDNMVTLQVDATPFQSGNYQQLVELIIELLQQRGDPSAEHDGEEALNAGPHAFGPAPRDRRTQRGRRYTQRHEDADTRRHSADRQSFQWSIQRSGPHGILHLHRPDSGQSRRADHVARRSHDAVLPTVPRGQGMNPLADFAPFPEGQDQFPLEFIESRRALKLAQDERRILIGLVDETDVLLKSELKYFFQIPLEFAVIDPQELAEFLGRQFSQVQSNGDAQANEKLLLDKLANDAPVVNLVNNILLEGIRLGCSDIHFEALSRQVRVRYRVDGVLRLGRTLPRDVFPSLSSRVKVMANLNIIERRQPQDGRLSVRAGGRDVEFRVSIVPLDGWRIDRPQAVPEAGRGAGSGGARLLRRLS